MLFSNVTNWRGMPFMKLSEFIMRSVNVPDFNHQVNEMAKEEYEYMFWNELTEEKKEQVSLYIRKK